MPIQKTGNHVDVIDKFLILHKKQGLVTKTVATVKNIRPLPGPVSYTHLVKLNPEVLQELEMNNSLGTPKAVMDKSWMDFDNSLPVIDVYKRQMIRPPVQYGHRPVELLHKDEAHHLMGKGHA